MKPKHLCLIAAMLAVFTLAAQPVINKQKIAGGNNNDYFSCMAFTRDGGMIAGGTSYSGISGDKTDTSRSPGYGDYWIVKLDKNGNKEWDKTIGGNLNDQLKAIQQTADGGYILGGHSNSGISGDKTAPQMGVDYWVVKLDNNGNRQWDKTYGLPRESISLCLLNDLKQTKDSGFIMTGTGIGDEYEAPDWTIKTDANGNVQWDTLTGGENSLPVVIPTSEGGYLLGSTSVNHIDEESYYSVKKLTAGGQLQWSKFYRAGSFELSNLRSILQAGSNRYIVAGQSTGYGEDKSEPSRGYYDYWLVMIDSLGNVIKDKTIGGSDGDYLNSIDNTLDGGLVIGGYSYSNASGEKTENNRGGGGLQDADYWVVKLNSQGNIEWDKTVGGDTTDILMRIQEKFTNRFIAGGYSFSGISGDKTKAPRGLADYWLVNIQGPAPAIARTMENNQLILKGAVKNDFTVYPNPAKDILHVQNVGEATITLTNQSGKTVLVKIINGNEDLNIGHLPGGLYFLKYSKTGEVQKIIITK